MTTPHPPAVPGGGQPATGARAHQGRPLRWWTLAAAGIVAGTSVVMALRFPAAVGDVRAMLIRIDGRRLPWLGAAAAAEALSLAATAAGQRHLLAVGGVRLGCRTLFGLALAYTGLASLIPAGQVPAAAWLAGQYRRRGANGPLAWWAVLGGRFAASVTIVSLLLAGAAITGLGSPLLLALAAALVAAAAVGLVALAHHARAVSRWLLRRPRGRAAGRLTAAAAGIARLRAGYRRGSAVLLLAGVTWLAGAAVLAAAFELAALPIPWRGLLLAYATSQVAGTLIPLPGGLGGVEGGLLGVLILTGTPLAAAATAALIYRVLGYWAVGAAGTVANAVMTRRPPAARPHDHPEPAASAREPAEARS